MSRREEYEQKAEELITPIVEANGFELVDVSMSKRAVPGICVLTSTKKAESPWMTAKSSAVHFLTGWTQRTLSMTPISWRSAPRALDVR